MGFFLYIKDMKIILENEQFIRTLKRMTHEIIEKNDNLTDVILMGIERKGMPIAKYIKDLIMTFEGINVELYTIDISYHRDDLKRIDGILNLPINIDGKTIILIDDVLYTGRSVRSAMDALMDFGRPAKIELAVVVDRGHRELPIRADVVGKNIPTSINEHVICDFDNKMIYLN